MRSGDKEVTSAVVCQGPAAPASMDKKTPKKNRHSERSIWLHHPCLLKVPMVEIHQYGYIAPTFLGSPWWGEKRDGN